MDINFFGVPYIVTKYAIPYCKESAKSSGCFIEAGYRGLPGRSGYSASKYRCERLAQHCATGPLDTGVNVMRVCPGFTASNIVKRCLGTTKTPLGVNRPGWMKSKMMRLKNAHNIFYMLLKKKTYPLF